MKAYNQFKMWLALKITATVSTMECAFMFACLALFGFPPPGAPPSAYVQWVSQTFIQLVMLSVLSVQQKIMSDMQQDHHAVITSMQAEHKEDMRSLHEKFDTHIARKKVQKANLPPRGKGGRFMKKEAIA